MSIEWMKCATVADFDARYKCLRLVAAVREMRNMNADGVRTVAAYYDHCYLTSVAQRLQELTAPSKKLLEDVVDFSSFAR